MTKPEFLQAVATKSGIGKNEVDTVLDGIIEVISESVLKGGDQINIPGLGMFKQKKSEARTGRNPQTGAAVAIPAKTSIAFKMSSTLK